MCISRCPAACLRNERASGQRRQSLPRGRREGQRLKPRRSDLPRRTHHFRLSCRDHHSNDGQPHCSTGDQYRWRRQCDLGCPWDAPDHVRCAERVVHGAKNHATRRETISLGGGGGTHVLAARSSIISASGSLALTGVTIQGSEFPVDVEGNATITDSKFLGNSGSVLVEGNATVTDSKFLGNSGNALSLNEGTVEGSTFSGNTGGAIRVDFPTGRVSIVASTFDGNTGDGAITLSQRSGRSGAGEVSIRRSVFRNGVSQTGGGAIRIFDTTLDAAPEKVKQALQQFPPAHFEFSYNQFINNSAKRGGAIQADLANTKGLIIEGGIFLRNVASESGGALAWNGRSVTVTHSLFKANRAGGSGGAISASDPELGASWGVTNSLFVENAAAPSSGALDMSYASIVNSTIANNVGFGIVITGTQSSFIANTILSKNSAGNCKGVIGSAFKGSNLQFGSSDCPNVTTEDPFLDSLFVPSLGSRALEIGQLSICEILGTDIVFQTRGDNGKCAVGAFERPPVRRVEAAIESQGPRPPEECPAGSPGCTPACTCPKSSAACPKGSYGHWPDCRTAGVLPKHEPEREKCPAGTEGSWPHCRSVVLGCGLGMAGVPPFCFPRLPLDHD